MEKVVPLVNPAAPGSRPVPARSGCAGCRTDHPLEFDFEYAFQPIVNVRTRTVFAHEALIRGPQGEPAETVLSRVNDGNRYQFDQACRVKAVATAARLGMTSYLSINFLPNAVYRPEACIQSTLKAAKEHSFPHEKIIFEVTESEKVFDKAHLLNIFRKYSDLGFKTAIDDFGAGYSGLGLLSDFQPSILKLDMDLIRGIDRSPPRQAIVKGVLLTSRLIGTQVVAEGVETPEERDYLREIGVELMQGFLFCRPAFQGLGEIAADAW
ncbi:EAL domain-containing protein [Noviherbaspirillum sp. 17J57-3]|uniref:EAL domain-containing protein n=2 Tax=Noviherbaspirillum galbum TaxID=2709383 RepID=A0A6B3SQ85_9BURK|nr:EAL domain-containing protein [Noviherbaspirillum galbum]